MKKLVDEAMAQNNEELTKTENDRDTILKEIGNIVHDDVPVSNDEVGFLTVCHYLKKKKELIWDLDQWIYIQPLCTR